MRKEEVNSRTVRVKFQPDLIGKTDAIDTYCCELFPSWYVVFPEEKPWEGHYFHVKDLEVLEEE